MHSLNDFGWYNRETPSTLLDAVREKPESYEEHLRAIKKYEILCWDSIFNILKEEHTKESLAEARKYSLILEGLRNEFLESGYIFESNEGWWIGEIIVSLKDLIKQKVRERT